MDSKRMTRENFAFLLTLLDNDMIRLQGLSTECMIAWREALQGDLGKLHKIVLNTEHRLQEFKTIKYDRKEMQHWADGMANHLAILLSTLRLWLGLFRSLHGAIKYKGKPHGKERDRISARHRKILCP